MYFRKFIASLTIIVFSLVATNAAIAQSPREKEVRKAAKIRKELDKLGLGSDARIQVKLRDKTKISGYLSQVGDDHLVITEDNGAEKRVAYSDVRKARGNNLSTGMKIAIAVSIVAAVLAILLFFENYG